MASATERSFINKFLLTSADGERQVDISAGVAGDFYFYEDIFSPVMTAKTLMLDTGRTRIDGDKYNESFMSALPLKTGENVEIIIENQRNQTLNLSLKVFEASQVFQQDDKNLVFFNFISPDHFKSESTRVYRKLPAQNTTENIRSILVDDLKSDVEFRGSPSSSAFSYQGNSRKPFTVIMDICPRTSSEENGRSAGFFFYQTREGYNFRSVKDLIDQPITETYTYGGTADDVYEPKTPFGRQDPQKRILKYRQVQTDNLNSKAMFGAFGGKRFNFKPSSDGLDPDANSTFDYEDFDATSFFGNATYEPPADATDLKFTRQYISIQDMQGLTDRLNVNFDHSIFDVQGPITYNSIFSQILNITVPQNLNLHAGNTIVVNISKAGCQFEYDEKLSGKYLIKEVCHHVTNSRSYSHLLIVRDTLGS